jgi:O-antigen/teichoic acid export membrane protein
MSPAARVAGPQPPPAVRAVAALSRHASIYAGGNVLALLVGLVSLIVLTRFLDPAEFGKLGLALVTGSFVAVGLNALLLMGAVSRALRGGDADEDFEADERDVQADDPRRALGTAIVAIFGGCAVLMVVAAATWPAGLDEETAALLVVAVTFGGFSAVWRMLTVILRKQRRPFAYVALTLARPILILAVVVPLAAAGAEAVELLCGFAAGAALAAAIAAVVQRRLYRLAFDAGELRVIVTRSLDYLPVILGFWVVQNTDIFILAASASAAQVGEYRLASRFGALAAFAGSAILTAWGPLRRSGEFVAADEAHGVDVMRSGFATYFLLVLIGIGLTLSLAAEELVDLAPATYGGAGTLVPVLALAFCAQLVLQTVYRTSAFPRRRKRYRVAVPIAAAGFVPACFGLVALLGPPGAAVATILAFAALTAWVVGATKRAERAQSVEPRVVLPAAALAIALYAAVRLLGGGVALDVLALVLFAVAARLLVPSRHRALLGRAALLAVPRRRPRTTGGYVRVLRRLQRHGVELQPLSRERPPTDQAVVLLRHDVRGAPDAVWPLAEAEERLGLRSTWLFPAEAADPAVLRRLRDAGHRVGLLSAATDRKALKKEVAAFTRASAAPDVVARQPELLPDRPGGELVTETVPRPGLRDGVLVVVDEAPEPVRLPVLFVTLPARRRRARR